MKTVLLLQLLAYVCTAMVHTSIQFSGQFYKDLKISVQGNPFKAIKILATADFDAMLRCARTCASFRQCQAFNFYKELSAYFCEMMPANTRLQGTRMAYFPRPGAVVWEKMSTIGLKPFLDEKLAGVAIANYCPTIKPGCLGTWPNCIDCVKTCIDCFARNNNVDSYTCTLWPGPTEQENTPITTTCYKKFTHLMRRTVNLTNGEVTDSYIMPFRDMNRLCRLNAYSTLLFFFAYETFNYQAQYSDPYIMENGTLMNLKFLSSPNINGDGLNLGTGTLQPVPFVSVSDDRYNCGSFWLFDSNNATYCPGGGVGLFGTPRLDNSGKVIDSGIHWPLATSQGKMIYRTDLSLYMA